MSVALDISCKVQSSPWVDQIYDGGIVSGWRSDSYGCIACFDDTSSVCCITSSQYAVGTLKTWHCSFIAHPQARRNSSAASLYASMAPWSAIVLHADDPFEMVPRTTLDFWIAGPGIMRIGIQVFDTLLMRYSR